VLKENPRCRNTQGNDCLPYENLVFIIPNRGKNNGDIYKPINAGDSPKDVCIEYISFGVESKSCGNIEHPYNDEW